MTANEFLQALMRIKKVKGKVKASFEVCIDNIELKPITADSTLTTADSTQVTADQDKN